MTNLDATMKDLQYNNVIPVNMFVQNNFFKRNRGWKAVD